MHRITEGRFRHNGELRVGEEASDIDLDMGCTHCRLFSKRIMGAHFFSGKRLIEIANLCPKCRDEVYAGHYVHPLTDAYTVRLSGFRAHIKYGNL